MSGAVVITDVTAPLLGPAGAATVFGPQKGADPPTVTRIDAALKRWATFLGGDPFLPGAGAAGGAGYGLLAWGAALTPGAEAVADLICLDTSLTDANLVVTGEGSYDAQSEVSKVPAVVSRRAARAGAPIAIVAGRIGVEVPPDVTAVSLTELAGSAELSMREPRTWLNAAGEHLAAVALRHFVRETSDVGRTGRVTGTEATRSAPIGR